MRKNNVWKQALALVLSATLVLGNVSPVSAATGDAGTGEGATGPSVVSDMDAYEAIEFTADGRMVSDSNGYEENGITFSNEGVEIVDAPVITPGDGVTGTDGGDDGGHGRVFKFSNGITDPAQIATATGTTYITSVSGSLSKYDYSIGATFSFDIYPEQQSNDWNYLFGIGVFEDPKHALVGTVGFSAGFDSEEKRQDNEGKENASWQPFTPNDSPSPWIAADKGGYEWDYFKQAGNAHKWYNIKYTYTVDGMTIAVNDVPIITYRDTNGYMENILKNLNNGQLRLGKGVVPSLEGYVGLMDNVRIEPIAPHEHVYEEENPKGTVIKEPTCTEVGTRRMPKCTICHVMPTEVIPALGHTFEGAELVSTKPATCTTNGWKAHYECTRECGEGYAVDDATAEGGKKEVGYDEIKLDKFGHDYETTITKATPEKDGLIREVCKNDSNHVNTTVIHKASNITLAGTEFTYNGGEFKPAVIVKDSKGTVISADNYNVEYSNNVQVGTATVKITFKGDNYEGTATKTFTIKAATAAANLVLDKSSVTLYTGNAQKSLTIKVTTVTGASQTVTWKSDNDKIAKVDNKGKITAVKAGTTNVRATANGVTKVVKVTVKNPTITLKSGKKKFTKKTVNVKRKKKTTLTVSVSPSKSGFKLGKMTSKQKKIAKVSLNNKGKLVIQGKKKGSFKIKITSGKATKTLTIKVK